MNNEYLDMINGIHNKKKKDLTKEQARKIVKAYETALTDTADMLQKNSGKLSRRYYNKLTASLATEINKITQEGILKGAKNVTDYEEMFLKDLAGFENLELEFPKMFSQIPSDTLEAMMAGGIYTDGKGLSSRIWNISKKSADDIQNIIYAGTSNGMSATRMAKMLEQHVNPAASNVWGLEKLKKYLGPGYAYATKKVDYNALRLARTSISHSYTLAAKQTAKESPFLEKFKWRSVFAHGRTCEICMDRDGTIYTAAALPYDHPNGLCYETPYFDKPLSHYADRLKKWNDGKDDITLQTWYNKQALGMAPSKAKKSAQTLSKYKKSLNTKQMVQSGQHTKAPHIQKTAAVDDFKEIVGYDNQTNWNRDHFEKWVKSMDSEEIGGIRTYTGGDYRPINAYLRGVNDTVPNYLKPEIDNAIRALKKAKIPENVEVYRGGSARILKSAKEISDSVYYDLLDGKGLEKLQGAVISDKGFMSTSLSKRTAYDGMFKGDLEIVLRVKKGVNAGYVDHISSCSGEMELLFPPGSKLRIISADTNTYHRNAKLRVIVEALK